MKYISQQTLDLINNRRTQINSINFHIVKWIYCCNKLNLSHERVTRVQRHLFDSFPLRNIATKSNKNNKFQRFYNVKDVEPKHD